MAQIKKFDKVAAGLLRQEINEALAFIGTKYGIDLSIGTITYTPTTISTKLTAGVKTSAQTAEDGTSVGLPASHKWVVAFQKNHWKFGLQKTDLNRIITHPLHTGNYRIVGITMHGKQPIVVQKVDAEGRPLTTTCMLLPAHVVQNALKLAA